MIILCYKSTLWSVSCPLLGKFPLSFLREQFYWQCLPMSFICKSFHFLHFLKDALVKYSNLNWHGYKNCSLEGSWKIYVVTLVCQPEPLLGAVEPLHNEVMQREGGSFGGCPWRDYQNLESGTTTTMLWVWAAMKWTGAVHHALLIWSTCPKATGLLIAP